MTRRRLLVAVCTAALLAAGTPAYADDDGWQSPACATGEITDRIVERDENGDVIIQLDGWSARCGLGHATDRYQFGLILYTDDDAWIGQLTDYQGTSPTPFTYRVNYTASTVELGSPPIAMCLAYDHESRLSCLAVHSLAPNQPPTTGPIPIDDDRVGLPPDDICATCVRQ
jgi:hypothetical protein